MKNATLSEMKNVNISGVKQRVQSVLSIKWMLIALFALGSLVSYGQTTYTWNQTGTASWATAANWTPTRTTPATNDILVFSNGATTTVTSVPTQTIGKLQISGNTTVNLQAAGANTLTISGGATALSVASGSNLNTNGANALQINIATGSTGSVTGNMTFTNAAHTITAADASGLTFNSPSVFTAGTGFTGNAFGSGTNNSVVFATGSTYVCQAGGNPFQKTQPASVVVFQTGSLYKHQVAAAPSLSGRTYANFQYDVSATNSSTGGNAFVCDNLSVTLGTFNIGMTGTPGHAIKGNISVSTGATLAFNPASAGTINLSGTAAQTITRSGTLSTVANQTIVVNNTNGVTVNSAITLTGPLTVNSGSTLAVGATLTTNGAVAMNGTFQIEQSGFANGTGTWTYNSTTGKLAFNNTSGSYGVSGTPVFWPTTNGPTDVNVKGAGGITMSIARTVATLFQTSAGVTTANNLTFNGTAQINGGGFMTGTPTYGASSTLVYNTSSYTTTTNEFPASGVKNVTITAPSGTNTITLDGDKTITGTFAVGDHIVNGGKSLNAGTITIGAGSMVMGDLTTSTAFTCTGNSAIGLTGAWNVTGFAKSTSTVSFNGTGSINNATSFYNVNQTSGTRTLATNIDIENTFNVSGGDFRTSGGRTLTMSGSAATINITTGSITGTDAGSGNDLSLVISGAQTNLTGNATSNFDSEKKFFNVTVNNGSTLALSRGILVKYGTFTVNGTLQINGNGYVNTDAVHAGNHRVPAYNASSSLLRYNNGGAYTIAGEWPATNQPVNVSLTATGTNVILTADRTITGVLSLNDNTITTSSNTLYVSNSATSAITRTSGYVIGNLKRAIATGTNSYAYPIGTASGYTGAAISLSGVSGAGDITAATLNGASGNYPAGLSTTKRLARYWTISNSGVSGFTASVLFEYLGADLTGGATSSSIKAYQFTSPSTYDYPSFGTGTNTFNVGGLTSFGEFGAGECDGPTAGITNNSGSTVLTCALTSISVTATGGATYSWDNGLGTNANASITAPGTYTVTATAANGCSDTESIIVTQDITTPTAGITNNSGSTVLTCALTSISVTATGGGTYSWDNGLGTSANASITAPGTYTVTVTGSNGCTDTESIIVTQDITTPTAGITNNSGSTVLTCALTSISVTATGGVSYSWDNGLGTDANASITAPGTYTVTVTGSNGCTDTESIIVTQDIATPTAGITNNTGSTVINCTVTSISVTATGGVSYSWDNGLGSSANATITLGGTYTVTVTGSNGCTDTESIVITQDNTAPATPGAISGPTDVCPFVGTTVTYSIAAVSGAVSYVWTVPAAGATIQSGQGTTSITVLIDNAFAQTNQQFKVRAVAANGCSSANSSLIVLKNIPGIPTAITGPTNVCAFVGQPTTATYTIDPVTYATSYTWTVQGTGMSIVSGQGGLSVEISYASNFTTGSVRVTANSNCGSRTPRSLSVTKTAPVAPAVINGPTDVCSYIGTSTQATYSIDPVANAASYTWTLPAGVTLVSGQGTTSINVTFNSGYTPGILKVKSVSNCGNSGDRQLTIGSTPPATPGTISGPTNVCEYVGTSTQVTYSIAAVSGATSYTWSMPTNAVLVSGQGTTSVQVTFNAGYIPSVMRVKAVSACGSSSDASLTIGTIQPSAPTAINGSASACSYVGTATQVAYSVDPVATATSYLWTLPANVTLVSGQGTNSILVTFGNAYSTSTFKVRAVSGCGNSADATLSVTAASTSTPGAITGPTNACLYINTSNVATYSIRKVATAASYTWTVPTGATITGHPGGTGANDTAITVTFDNSFVSGSTIQVQAVNCNTTSPRSISILRTTASTPGLISGPTNVCEYMVSASNPSGIAATYTIRKVSSALSYTWTAPANATITGHPAGTGENDTTVTVIFNSGFTGGTLSVSASNGCGNSGTRTLTLTRFTPSAPGVIDVIQTDVCPNRMYTYSVAAMPSNATAINWTVPSNGTIVSGQGTISITVSYTSAAVNGAVTATATSNCGNSATRSLTVKLAACASFSAGGNNPASKGGLVSAPLKASLYPNPTTDAFRIQLNQPGAELVKVRILDLSGRVVKQQTILPGNGQTIGSDLKAGTYMVEITRGNEQVIEKLIKQ